MFLSSDLLIQRGFSTITGILSFNISTKILFCLFEGVAIINPSYLFLRELNKFFKLFV